MSGTVRVFGGNGHLPLDVPTTGGDGLITTLTLDDGRTLSVSINDRGHVRVRAYAIEPAATNGQAAMAEVSFDLPTAADALLADAQVTGWSMQTSRLQEKHLTPADQDPRITYGQTWTDAARQRYDTLRGLLALRR